MCLLLLLVQATTTRSLVLDSVDQPTSSIPHVNSGTVDADTMAAIIPANVADPVSATPNSSLVGSVPLVDAGIVDADTMAAVSPAVDVTDPVSASTPSGSLVDAIIDASTSDISTDCRPGTSEPRTGDRSLCISDQVVTFASLMPIPHRERREGKSVRKKPPSYNLVSEEHFEFVRKTNLITKKSNTKDKSVMSTNRHAPGQKLPTACTSMSKGKLRPDRHNVSSKGKGKAKKSGSSDTTPCASCGKRFCDDQCGEKWIKCQVCCNWFQNACQGIDKSYAGRLFTCISCDDSD
jgi:hypothetical protein